MCLSDTAEYWQKTYPKDKGRYLHLQGKPCGKITGGETDTHYNVTCKHCKKTDHFKELKEASEKAYEATLPPKCSCGRRMTERVNKSSGNKFYGCSGYPKCKNTMSIK